VANRGAILLSLFKRRRFPVEIILLCVRWYCKYGISYRDLAEMMEERGVAVDPSTIFRWVQRYAPEMTKRVRQYQGYRSEAWRVDETYGRWKYLFRAVDKFGQLIASMLAERRDTKAASRFVRQALKTMSDHPPCSITTDKLASYPKAIRRLQSEGLLPKNVEHRTSKYLNNIIEADHGALKRMIRPVRGFQRMKTASRHDRRLRGAAHGPPWSLRPKPSGRGGRNPSGKPTVRTCCMRKLHR
jgi:transposase-like protein